MSFIKKLVNVYISLLIVNSISNIFLNKFSILELFIYNLICSITYLLYREFNLWGERTLNTLKRIQKGENTQEVDWKKIIDEKLKKRKDKGE